LAFSDAGRWSLEASGRSSNVGAPTQNQPTFFIFWLNRAKFDPRVSVLQMVQHGPAWSRTNTITMASESICSVMTPDTRHHRLEYTTADPQHMF
jgi:hypothetical protein